MVMKMKSAVLIMLLAAFIIPVVADDVDRWIQDLKDPIPSVREAAAVALGQLNDTHAVGPLTQALQDENEGVRQAASQALDKLEMPAEEPNSEEDSAVAIHQRDFVFEKWGAYNFEDPSGKRYFTGYVQEPTEEMEGSLTPLLWEKSKDKNLLDSGLASEDAETKDPETGQMAGSPIAWLEVKLKIIGPIPDGETGTVDSEYHFSLMKSGIPDNAKYDWSFGDGSSSSGENATHTFRASGIYKVEVNAEWGSGSANDKTDMEIIPKKEEAKDEEVTFIVFRWIRPLGINPDTGRLYDKERQYCQDFKVNGHEVHLTNGEYSTVMSPGRHKYDIEYIYEKPLPDSGTASGYFEVKSGQFNAIEIETPPAEYNA
jgi:hypothetical protein